MSNYTKTTNFGAKDTLPSGDSQKIIRGTEFDTEFNNIATAIATKLEVDGSNNLAISGTFSSTKLIPTGGTATGNGMYLPAANTLALSTNGTERVRVDSSGNLGLGVTPSGNYTLQTQINFVSGFKGALLGGAVIGASGSGYPGVGYGARFTNTGDSYLYGVTDTANLLTFKNGGFQFLTAPSGTAGNTITFTQAMTLDSSGNLGVGRTPSGSAIVDVQNDANAIIRVRGGTGSNEGSAFYGVSGSDTTRFAFGQVSRILGGTPNDNAVVYAAGYLAFAAASSERARIDSSGNLGVGSTSPEARLHLYSASADVRNAIIANGVSDAAFQIAAWQGVSGALDGTVVGRFGLSYSTTKNAYINFHRGAGTTGGFLSFSTNDNTERMRLDSSGNLGIGITSPLSKINAVGGIRSSDSSTETNAIQMSASATAGTIETRYGTPLVFGTNATERARIDSSGNLGIGVTPSAWSGGFKATQYPGGSVASYASGTNLQIEVGNAYYQSSLGTYAYYNTGTAPTLYRQLSGEHRWLTAPSGTAGNTITFTQAMTLDANGLLLVGTTSPINNGTVEVTGTSRQAFVAKVTDNANSLFQGFDSSGTNRVFQVTGSGIMSVNNIYAFGTTTPLVFGTNSTERARIDSSGNFGIGTSSPSVKLDIRGIAHFFSGASGTFNHINIGRTGSEARIGVAAATNDFLTGVTAGDSVFYSVSTGNSWYGTASSGAAVFSTNNTERARIKSTGQLRFVPLSADPAGAETGDVYYNSTSNKLKVYNGTAWVDLH